MPGAMSLTLCSGLGPVQELPSLPQFSTAPTPFRELGDI